MHKFVTKAYIFIMYLLGKPVLIKNMYSWSILLDLIRFIHNNTFKIVF